ncbi:hypothetical protein PSPO_b0255 [Pseudoalteromonas spongiae UST010723-006]|nr:hypothetical protein PSPO_b0255 [Pseudoalteromonas spongiae UST010723-006]
MKVKFCFMEVRQLFCLKTDCHSLVNVTPYQIASVYLN